MKKLKENESARLRSVWEYNLLDTGAEEQFDGITKLAAAICDAPMAGISLIDSDRVWFKSKFGACPDETPRESAYCTYVLENSILNVPDTNADGRFQKSPPLAAGEGNFRAYLGVALVGPGGHTLGALCVADFKPHEFSDQQVAALQALGKQAVSLMELHRKNLELECMGHALEVEKSLYRQLVENLQGIVFQIDPLDNWSYLNPAWKNLLGHEPCLGRPFWEKVNPIDREALTKGFAALRAGEQTSFNCMARFATASGEEKTTDFFARVSDQGASRIVSGTITDITLLLSAFRKGHEQESVLNSFFTASPTMMGIVELSEDDIIVLSENPAVRAFTIPETGQGIPRTYPYSSLGLGLSKAQLGFWRSKYSESLLSRKPVSFDYKHSAPSGDFWLKTTVNYIDRGPNGFPRFSYMMTDETESRSLHQTLVNERALLSTVTDHLGDVIWMEDMAAESIVFINPAYEKIWGQSMASLKADGRSFLDSIHPDDREYIRVSQAERDQPDFVRSYRVIDAKGTVRWVTDRAFSVKDESGRTKSLVGIVSDVTEIRAKEAVSRHAKETVEAILNNIPMAIALFDEDGKHEWLNEEWSRIMGMDAHSALGKGILENAFPSREEYLRAVEHARSDGHWAEFQVASPQGEPRTINFAMASLPSGKRIAIVQDMSFEKEQTKMIEEQRSKIVESGRFSALGEMAGGIAHEINNPLAIIQGSAQIISTILEGEKEEGDDDRMKKSVDRIEMMVTRVAKIISGLKSFSRDGKQDPMVPTNLQNVISETLELCQARFRNHGVELYLELTEGPVEAPARGVQLSQVLLNLLNNAFDAVAPQKEKKIRIQLSENEDYACLRVLDNGPGVPPELHEKIMQPFFTTKPPGKGTGIGLSLSRKIVEDHGGKIALTNVNGATCFEVRIPKRRPQAKAA